MAGQLMLGAGKPLTIAGKIALLFGASAVVTPAPTPGGPMPTTGLAGWWDASALAWGGPASTLTDKSTAGKNAAATGAVAVPRLAGTLGGLYAEASPFASPFNMAYIHPIIADYAVTANSIAVGTGSALTVFGVWSRANQRQPNAVFSTAPVTLCAINGTPVLNMTANGDGNDTLVLFPNGAALPAGKLELRHTHSYRLVFSGSTVDVWLDGVKVITGASLGSFALGATANLSMLPNAQCIFHEAAAWSHALSVDEHASLTAYASRWPLGPRRAINGVVIGQSNAAKMVDLGSMHVVSKRVAYLTGCISSNLLIASGGNGQIHSGATTFSGSGMYDYSGTLFLAGSATDPATWPLGSQGGQFMQALQSMTSDQRANLRYVAWFWSETDSSVLTYASKATYTAGMKRAFKLIRDFLGVTADKLPILVINALPFSPGDEGCQTHREVMQDLVNDATQNCHFMLAQSGDAIGGAGGETYDPVTGLEGGPGDAAHRDSVGEIAYARRFGIPIARAALAANAAAGTPDVITAIDPSIPMTGGPKIASAFYEGTTYAPTGTVLVGITHDGGTSLKTPLRAALGVGWDVMDGLSDTVAGTPGIPGTRIKATACAVVDNTHLRITLASVPVHPVKAKLYYGYGTGLDARSYATIGQGNAVTDNFSEVTLPAGWNMKADMGITEQPNFPLQVTTYGIPVV